MTDPPSFIAVGRITRAHGLGGEVSVLPLSVVPARFQPGASLLVGEARLRQLTVAAARPHRNRILVTFREIRDRTQAEAVAGEYLFVASSASPALPDGEFWSHDLIGCLVVTETGRALGELREVVHTPANDVWVASGDQGAEVLIPALRDVVASVDLSARRVVVRDVPGLTAT